MKLHHEGCGSVCYQFLLIGVFKFQCSGISDELLKYRVKVFCPHWSAAVGTNHLSDNTYINVDDY